MVSGFDFKFQKAFPSPKKIELQLHIFIDILCSFAYFLFKYLSNMKFTLE